MISKRIGAIVAAFLVIAGCSFSSRSTAPVVRFHGEATDPVGDTAGIGDVRVAHPPDLVYASVQVTSEALHLIVRFSPGSLAPASTGALILLDTDLDTATGEPSPGIGADYAVLLSAGPVREANVARAVADPGCSTPCRFEPFANISLVLSSDEMEAVIPRSAFAQFDGRLNFRVITQAVLEAGRLSATSDHLPNLPAQFVAVR